MAPQDGGVVVVQKQAGTGLETTNRGGVGKRTSRFRTAERGRANRERGGGGGSTSSGANCLRASAGIRMTCRRRASLSRASS